jgi:DNA adenine methylase
MTNKMRPALRYYGGKWKMAPWIISHLPEHRIYVEPFGGGASVLLRKPRSNSEVYNDIDAEVHNVFVQLRDNGQELKRLLSLTPFSRLEFEEAHEPAAEPIEQARRTIIKAFMGIGTDAIQRKSNGFRADSKRNCAADWRSYADVIDILIDRLRGVIMECRDYTEVIKAHDSPDTLFYIDPPYVHSTRASATGKYSHEMSDDEHRKLAKILHKVKGKVVLSGYPCDLYDELYADWHRDNQKAFAFFAGQREEIVWANFEEENLSLFKDTP